MLETIQSTVIELESDPERVLNLFKKFERIHEEISTARLEFIKIQNALFELNARDAELDAIGEGYSVIKYESLKISLQVISSHIDVRNEDLEKLRGRYNLYVEKSENLKKNRESIERKIQQQRATLAAKEREEQEMRWQMNSMRKQKDLMRIEIDKLTQKSQLLTKLPLLKDFDAVSDGIENVNQKIHNVAEKKSQILKKIHRMESKVDNLRSHE